MAETYRWRPGPILWIGALPILLALSILLREPGLARIRPNHSAYPVAIMMMTSGATLLSLGMLYTRYRIQLDEQGIALDRPLSGEKWRLAWTEIDEIVHERHPLLSSGTDRLILKSAKGEKTVTASDPMMGRWKDFAGLLASVKNRGVNVREA